MMLKTRECQSIQKVIERDYSKQNLSNIEKKVAVFDLGGGTFDISVLEIGSGVFEVYFRSDGSVSHVGVARSTGHWVLDKECISTFKTWRCYPGRVTWFRVPVRFAIETK